LLSSEIRWLWHDTIGARRSISVAPAAAIITGEASRAWLSGLPRLSRCPRTAAFHPHRPAFDTTGNLGWGCDLNAGSISPIGATPAAATPAGITARGAGRWSSDAGGLWNAIKIRIRAATASANSDERMLPTFPRATIPTNTASATRAAGQARSVNRDLQPRNIFLT
jgi:hypothetical protein